MSPKPPHRPGPNELPTTTPANVLKFPADAMDLEAKERAWKQENSGLSPQEYEDFRRDFGPREKAAKRPYSEFVRIETLLRQYEASEGARRQEDAAAHAKRHAFYFVEWLLWVGRRNPAKAHLFLENFLGLDGSPKDGPLKKNTSFAALPPAPKGDILTQWTNAIGTAGTYARYADHWSMVRGHICHLQQVGDKTPDPVAAKHLVAAYVGIAINAGELEWGLGSMGGVDLCRSAAEEARKAKLPGWEAAARVHVAQMLVRMGKLGEAKAVLRECPEARADDIALRRRLVELEMDVRTGDRDTEGVLAELESVAADGFDMVIWKRYLQDLARSRADGVRELPERAGEAATNRYSKTKRGTDQARLEETEKFLLDAIHACDEGKNGWENQVPLIEPMALLSRSFGDAKKRREWALRAWAAFRNHFKGVKADSGFDPMAGPFGRAAWAAAAEAFFPAQEREISPANVERLDYLLEKRERDDLDRLEAELSARKGVNRPYELYRVLQRYCGVSGVLIAPLTAKSPIEMRSFGFTSAVAAYPGQEGIQGDEGRLQDYLARQEEIDSSQTAAQHAREKAIVPEWNTVLAMSAKCGENGWAPIRLPLRFGKYASATMNGMIFQAEGCRYLLVADRGSGRLLPMTPEMERRVLAFARNYVAFAILTGERQELAREREKLAQERQMREEEQERNAQQAEKSMKVTVRLAVAAASLLGASPSVVRRISHEAGTLMCCGQTARMGEITSSTLEERTRRFDDLIGELTTAYDSMLRVREGVPLATAPCQLQGPLDLAAMALDGRADGAGRWEFARGIRLEARGAALKAKVLQNPTAAGAIMRVLTSMGRTAPDGAVIACEAFVEPGYAGLRLQAPLDVRFLEDIPNDKPELGFEEQHFEPFHFRGNPDDVRDARDLKDLSLGCADMGVGPAVAKILLEEQGGRVRVPHQPKGSAAVELLFRTTA